MRRVLSLVIAGLFLINPVATAATLSDGANLSDDETARAIQLYYESRFEELGAKFQGHWALRMYRISGDRRFVDRLKPYGEDLVEELVQFVGALNNPVLRAQKIDGLLSSPQRPSKGKYAKRRQVLVKAPDYLYMHRLLYLAFMVQSLGLEQKEDAAFQRALAALKSFNFETYLRDEEILKYAAAAASNAVYYLKKLGLADHEDAFANLFQDTYRASDESLDGILFENKIYGLTHLMIADSEYYQRMVSPEKFHWILDYFAVNVDRILARSKPDVVAEVGLCFLLAGLSDHPVVAQTRKFLVQSWDPASGMIRSVRGSTDLNHGEHRNVLAFMLLKGFTQLHPGPNLSLE